MTSEFKQAGSIRNRALMTLVIFTRNGRDACYWKYVMFFVEETR
jgi:hypothetical protein